MKTYKVVEEKFVKIDQVICDICKITIESTGIHNADEISINAKLGNIYFGEDCRDEYNIDVCTDCFINKVKSLLESSYNIIFKAFPVGEELDILEKIKMLRGKNV